MEKLRAGVFSFLLAGLLSAQATHVVGPGGFAQVNAALAVAASGDTVLVMPGTYDAFAVDDSVTIRAAVPDTVTIGTILGWPVSSTVTLAAGQRVLLVDLLIHSLVATGGAISLDGCLLQATVFGTNTGLIVESADVVLQGCTLHGFNSTSSMGWRAGLGATDCRITAIDSSFRGGSVSSPGDGPHPGPAIHLVDSVFHGSHVSAWGGGGGGSYYVPQPALRAANSIVWISDSDLHGGTFVFAPSWPPACPLEGATGRLDRCLLTPATCGLGIPTTGPLLGVHRPAPMQSPGTLVLDYHTEANGLVGVFLSESIAPLQVPGLEQAVWLDVANLHSMALLVADGAGQASYSCTIPAGLANHAYWFQAVAPAASLHLSPLAGGVVR